MIAIAPTDLDWFEFLRDRLPTSEINFWTPTPWNVKRLEQDDRFYFLLKAPHRKIGGFGRFRYYEKMSVRDAWNRFGKGNGVGDLAELAARTSGYASQHSTAFVPTDNPEIGCIVLDRPVFFEESAFFRPEDRGKEFPPQVVRLKYFDEDFGEEDVGVAEASVGSQEAFQLVDETGGNYKNRRTRDRTGQAEFRRKVLAAYGRECCVTGEGALEVLAAAHIQPHVNKDSHHVQNGLALRVDLHNLFDAGLITVDDDYRLVISNRLKSEGYAAYNGQKVRLPNNASNRPSKEALELHRTGVFRT
jgi:putative restriction endonuclease